MAWLITWEHVGDHAEPDRRIAAILNPRWSPERVADIMHTLYAMSNYSAREKLRVAKNRKAAPYAAEFGQTRSGARFRGLITCGHNPLLRARIVDDLRPDDGSEAVEGVLWREHSIPEGKPPSLESDAAT